MIELLYFIVVLFALTYLANIIVKYLYYPEDR